MAAPNDADVSAAAAIQLHPGPSLPPADAPDSGDDSIPIAFGRHWPAILFVALFAFLLAAFPARNTDLWSHLAAGRNLVHGELSTTAFAAKARAPSFLLYDVALYAGYSAFGGAGLVLIKALLVVLIALILLRLSRTGEGWWMAAFCTALAMLAMSARLLVQPATVSCLLLALSLWLVRPREPESGRIGFLPPWQLVLLFVAWANIDGWFIIGLGVIALVWLGQVIDEPALRDKRFQALVRRVVAAAILALVCLINPSHVYAFALPAELAWSWQSVFAGTPAVATPFVKSHFTGIGQSPPGLAYYVLFGLGLLSFAFNLPRCQWQRLLPWLALGALSGMHYRAAPFFAVVAGPVLALNLQEIFAREYVWRSWQGPYRGIRRSLQQALAVVVAAGGLACAWPGWLREPPYEPRRLAFDMPPSLEAGAAAANGWREDAKLKPDTRWLHLAPDSAAAFAWFCPREVGVFDDNLSAAIRGDTAPKELAEQMRSARVNLVVVYDSIRGRLPAVWGRFLADPGQWPLLKVDGDLAIFGWRDPAARAAADPLPIPMVDFDRLAFHPADDAKAPPEAPEQSPEQRRWWMAFWRRLPPRSIDADRATVLLIQTELSRPSAPFRHKFVWDRSQSASLVGAAIGWNGPGGLLDARTRLALLEPQLPAPNATLNTLPFLDQRGWEAHGRFARSSDDISPALLYLGVRAARRAVAANPWDAQAHWVLGECYYHLLHSTRERAWADRMPEIALLRQIQASAALNQAVALRPSLAQAHLRLSELYRELGYLDLTLKHLRAYAELNQKTAGAADDKNSQIDKEVERLSKHVEQQTKKFGEASGKTKILDRARLALRAGLAEKTRDLLLESDVSAFGAEGMGLELELLLKTGRPRVVRDWLLPEHESTLGAASYYWQRAQALAAIGDYAEAERACDRLARSVAYEDNGKQPVPLHQVMAMLIGQAILDDHSEERSVPFLAYRAFRWMHWRAQFASIVQRMKQEADANTLRGLLALEEGEVFEAAVAFRTALSLWKDEAAAASGAGIDFPGRTIAQDCLHWLK